MPKDFIDSDSDDSDDYPYIDAEDFGSIPADDDPTEFITLHELLTLLDGKQQ